MRERRNTENERSQVRSKIKERMSTYGKNDTTDEYESHSPYREKTERLMRKSRYDRNFSTALRNFERNLSKFLPHTLGNNERGFMSFDSVRDEPSKK